MLSEILDRLNAMNTEEIGAEIDRTNENADLLRSIYHALRRRDENRKAMKRGQRILDRLEGRRRGD